MSDRGSSVLSYFMPQIEISHGNPPKVCESLGKSARRGVYLMRTGKITWRRVFDTYEAPAVDDEVLRSWEKGPSVSAILELRF
jgi:hypothetical protein